MGGGIAFQSASSGVHILMKDIRPEALELGLSTASAALDKLIARGELRQAAKQLIMDRISPQLNYDQFDCVDLVIEAVVENETIKANVLIEAETQLRADAILTSNTSTISIDRLATNLQRPEQFCGLHFFNPVPLMPLVEVVRGSATNDQTLARVVDFARSLGKTPVVVNDCPGFLVNRVLFPYFNGFNQLLLAGVDFQRMDRVMEVFGWPMGPASLADLIGIDTMVHADQVLQPSYPDRMQHASQPIMEQLFANGGLGQKNAVGFYLYGRDAEGRRTKAPNTKLVQLINAQAPENLLALTDQEIIDRLMIPICTESVRCLDEGVVASAADLDLALLLGIGFPKARGGALRYIEQLGLAEFGRRCDTYQHLGALYQLTKSLRARIEKDEQFY